ncbi:MAG TPA: DUF86 domain-containing protein [Clostridiales bacterium]|jgi:uncharacterized protein with HEPN domain|nr:DUF86 domain-containing protein [Clostridiales bacterium]HQP69711.1 DUF86 domain-containing protein [Clostridiales bacterium]
MPLNDKDSSYLWDIVQAGKEILEFINGISYHKFCEKKIIRYAVERQLLVIGEAANHLSDEFKASESEFPWEKIIGMRNIIAHEYGEILEERIWATANDHIKPLIDSLEKYL